MKAYCFRAVILSMAVMTLVVAQAQDTALNIPRIDFSKVVAKHTNLVTFYPTTFNYIYHSPEKADYRFYEKYAYLANQKPTEKSYYRYYQLATVLWKLSRTNEAEKLFLTIADSGHAVYSKVSSYSSDIPGDTSSNIYGYGSFTSDYRNDACLYLTKIYIEQQQFDKALSYLNKAIHTYPVEYTCGTGWHRQQDEYRFLEASCYAGLKRHQEVIDLLLPQCFNWQDTLLTHAIRQLYNESQIAIVLKESEESITCVVDTFLSYSYITSYGKGKKAESTDTISYHSGSGTITLFNKEIEFPAPSLEDGQTLTKGYYVDLFKNSAFTRLLKKED